MTTVSTLDPQAAEHLDSDADRLAVAAEQLRFVAKALASMSRLVPSGDDHLSRQTARVVARSEELMRATSRLAIEMGSVDDWGLHILFGSPEAPARPIRRARPDDTVDLEPIELLPRLYAPEPPPRVCVPMPGPGSSREPDAVLWPCAS